MPVVVLRGAQSIEQTHVFCSGGCQPRSESRFLFKNTPQIEGSVLIAVRSYRCALTVNGSFGRSYSDKSGPEMALEMSLMDTGTQRPHSTVRG